jgi:hypothetical protein
LGALKGDVEVADRIEIGRNAKVVGDIRTARIQIEDGAYFKGSIEIVKPEPLRKPTDFEAVVVAATPNQAGIAVGKQTDDGNGRHSIADNPVLSAMILHGAPMDQKDPV